MRVQDKINLDKSGLLEHGPINIVVFGDSVTHGAVETGVVDYETVYWNRLRKKINQKRDYVPVNIINAGIGGVTAQESLGRLNSQVLVHHADLVIVCFGLNDVNEPLEVYLNSLREIFTQIQQSGSELIFMTPNMLNTYVAKDVPPEYMNYAKKTAEMQSNGRMDSFMQAAVQLAKELNVTICDCYSRWKEISKTQDITLLLANRINHPIREMHELFAENLYETIFGNVMAVKESEYRKVKKT